MSPLELLAPARDATIARAAILHGADAVYMGGPSHGARAAAANSIEDIANTVTLAHQFGARVYVTLNTLIYEKEIHAVEALVRDYWRIGVDALIVQDLGLLRMDIPPIALHASTQCDIRTVQKAKFLSDCGFNQLVLPREFSLEQMREMRQALPLGVVLEAFVHGALCVSYSGDCQASCMANGRSANRGECAQMCRMAYDLIDDKGNVLMRDKHFLSLRDLCRLENLEDLVEAGISSFKIEGRLKDESYVKNIVAAYRKRLDEIIDKNPEKYCRSSLGTCQYNFKPDVKSSFNRGFTPYFLNGRPTAPIKMVNLDSPKWVGEPVGTVRKATSRIITADLRTKLTNGDGLGYFNKNGELVGFRLNRIEGNQLFPATSVEISPGTTLYRNRDAQHDALMARNDTATRLIEVNLELNWPLSLKVAIEGYTYVIANLACEKQDARSPQTDARKKALTKLGGTNYRVGKFTDNVDPMIFIPASILSELRRKAIDLLNHNIQTIHHYEYRQPEKEVSYPISELTYHDNVANSLSERFYREHGVKEIGKAIETQPKNSKLQNPDLRVMTTRYCLRRELGACLKEGGAKALPSPLYLRNKAATYLLSFDCLNCQMHLHLKNKN